jgi:hypothetical protein
MERMESVIDPPFHLEFPKSSTVMQTSDGQCLDSVMGERQRRITNFITLHQAADARKKSPL